MAPVDRFSWISRLAGVRETSDSVTFEVVAGPPASMSLARTLAMAVFAVLFEALARSATARMTFAFTVIETDASLQFDGLAVSQIRYSSVCTPAAVPDATDTAPVAALSVTPGLLDDSTFSVTCPSVAGDPSNVSFASTLAIGVPPVRDDVPLSFTA